MATRPRRHSPLRKQRDALLKCVRALYCMVPFDVPSEGPNADKRLVTAAKLGWGVTL